MSWLFQLRCALGMNNGNLLRKKEMDFFISDFFFIFFYFFPNLLFHFLGSLQVVIHDAPDVLEIDGRDVVVQ